MKTIKILGTDHTVVSMTRMDENTAGDYCFCNRTIRIQNDLIPGVKLEVLWHEIIEAINNKLELDLEHKQITCLGTAIHCVLEENGINSNCLLGGIK